ncbi:MAG: agmatine deiminase [Chloroflexi bacterium]|nr:MAG: agmatine deiminase [Chloroflexota bacterium]
MVQILGSTPREDGFRMPGEFEPHSGTWMLWPERPDNWRMGAKPAQHAFTEVAKAIAQFEPLTMGVLQHQYLNARRMLPSHIRVIEMSYNDSWMRDCGPTFIVDGHEIRAIDWTFNAWGGLEGGLYFPWDLDDIVPQKVAYIERVDLYSADMILEGGSIHVDGEGTCITTEECLLNPNRNPDMSREQIEQMLMQYLNVEKIIWLPKGVYNDETSGHVDNIACFIRPGEVALTWTNDRSDPQYECSFSAREVLEAAEDARGRKLKVHLIHQPEPIYITQEESFGVEVVEGTLPRAGGDRLAGSYVNFYFCNGAAVVPTFHDPHDQEALNTLQKLLPERKVVGIYAREILLGGGNIHCITQQQPAANLQP